MRNPVNFGENSPNLFLHTKGSTSTNDILHKTLHYTILYYIQQIHFYCLLFHEMTIMPLIMATSHKQGKNQFSNYLLMEGL